LADAIADYDEAICLNPGDVDAFYNRGNARQVAGDLAGAIADFEGGKAYAANDPDFPARLAELRATEQK
jgi:hypothetical protein